MNIALASGAKLIHVIDYEVCANNRELADVYFTSVYGKVKEIDGTINERDLTDEELQDDYYALDGLCQELAFDSGVAYD